LDQTHALGVPARDGDFVDAGAHQGSLAADEHHFITFDDLQCAYQLAVALVDDHSDHALATTPTTRIFIQQCALTVTTLGGRQNLHAGLRNNHGHKALPFRQSHATHTTGAPPHWTHMFFLEPQHLAAIGEQHDFARA